MRSRPTPSAPFSIADGHVVGRADVRDDLDPAPVEGDRRLGGGGASASGCLLALRRTPLVRPRRARRRLEVHGPGVAVEEQLGALGHAQQRLAESDRSRDPERAREDRAVRGRAAVRPSRSRARARGRARRSSAGVRSAATTIPEALSGPRRSRARERGHHLPGHTGQILRAGLQVLVVESAVVGRDGLRRRHAMPRRRSCRSLEDRVPCAARAGASSSRKRRCASKMAAL